MVNNYKDSVIITSFDQNYIEYAAVFIKSLSINYHEDHIFDLMCLVPQNLLFQEGEFVNKINCENLNIKFKCSDRFNKLDKDGLAYEAGYISKNMSHRLFIGSLFPQYKKGIYIDPDTYVNRNIKPLIDYPLSNKLLATVEYSGMSKKTFSNPDLPYFNNGVFIADLDYWRKENLEDKFINWIKNNGPTDCIEQDAMNFVFRNKWSPLPITFNLLAFKLTEDKKLSQNYEDPLIVHFVGDLKPWGEAVIPTWTNKWRELQKKLKN